MKQSIYKYSAAATGIFALDQLTKRLAYTFCQTQWHIAPGLSCKVSQNRGIAWGLLHFLSPYMYTILTGIIVLVIAVLFWYARSRLRSGYVIWGETLVIAGALSNVCDRLFLQGVIDFIVIGFGLWAWPTFNIADVAIVIGILIMLIFEKQRAHA